MGLDPWGIHCRWSAALQKRCGESFRDVDPSRFTVAIIRRSRPLAVNFQGVSTSQGFNAAFLHRTKPATVHCLGVQTSKGFRAAFRHHNRPPIVNRQGSRPLMDAREHLYMAVGHLRRVFDGCTPLGIHSSSHSSP